MEFVQQPLMLTVQYNFASCFKDEIWRRTRSDLGQDDNIVPFHTFWVFLKNRLQIFSLFWSSSL